MPYHLRLNDLFSRSIHLSSDKPLATPTMSWRCTSTTNAGLIANLWTNSLLRTPRIRAAMEAVDRGDYTNKYPYEDAPQRIGHGATISAPHMHAMALEELKEGLEEGGRVLDVGCGSGYLCAVMAELVGPTGQVTGVEHIPQLTELSRSNISKSPRSKSFLDSGTISLHTADGRLGFPARAPYTAIHVGAAAKELHSTLLDQLAPGGRMVIPVEDRDGSQYIWRVEKDGEGVVKKHRLFGVMYVPLTDRPGGEEGMEVAR